MKAWWRAPLIAAAVSTLLCVFVDFSYRHRIRELDSTVETSRREWRSDAQLANQLDHESDMVGMLGIRREATAFVHRKVPPVYPTFNEIVSAPALRGVRVNVSMKHFEIKGPLSLQPATEDFLAHQNGARITKRTRSTQEFVIAGVVP